MFGSGESHLLVADGIQQDSEGHMHDEVDNQIIFEQQSGGL